MRAWEGDERSESVREAIPRAPSVSYAQTNSPVQMIAPETKRSIRQ